MALTLPSWFFLLLFSLSLQGTVHDPKGLLSPTGKVRVEQLSESKFDVWIETSPKESVGSLSLFCANEIEGCRRNGGSLKDQLEVQDVSFRAYAGRGFLEAVERGTNILKSQIEDPSAPWRDISFTSLFTNPNVFLPRDNLQAGYFGFEYIVGFLRHFNQLPDWFYSQAGGSGFEPFHMNFHMFIPYRLVGYALAKLTSYSPNTLYKFTLLFIGVPFFMFGIYWLSLLLFTKPLYGIIAVALCLSSSFCFGVLHAEQNLGTITYLPYIWICLLKLRHNPYVVFVLVSLAGLSLTVHYPYYFMSYVWFLFFGLAISFKSHKAFLLETAKGLKPFLKPLPLLLLVLCFVISISPTLYSFLKYRGQLYSPLRGYEIFGGLDYAQYLQRVKNYGYDMKALFLYGANHEDMRVILWNASLPFLSALLPFVRFKGKTLLVCLTFLCGLASLGTYSPFPRVLWYLVPTLALFRQWYQFILYFNLHLLFLSLFALHAYFKVERPYKKVTAATLILLGVFSGAQWITGSWTRYKGSIERNTLDRHSFKPSTVPFAYGTWFHENPIYEGSEEFFVPSSFDYKAVKKLNAQNPAHWSLPGGEYVPIQSLETKISVSKKGFRFSLGPEHVSQRVVLHQFNDGDWKVTDQAGNSLTVEKSREKTLEIGLHSDTTEIVLERRPSLFPWLVILMWLPLLGSLAFLRLRGRRAEDRVA